MTYKDTITYLYNKLPIYQRVGAAAYKKDIGNIISASKKLHNPHLKFKSIHIGGTNGKGSTAHLIASVFQEAGYKVGIYSSPHLRDFRERIKINGEMIKKKEVVNFIKKNKSLFEKIQMSFFEMTVILSFDFFAKEKVDIAIIEVGLGGRLDSTNIIQPELSIITNVSLDHTEILGESIEKIAFEKAGIIKKNTEVIIGKKQKETKQVFDKIAKLKNSNLIYSSEHSKKYDCDLDGSFQQENIKTCISAVKEMKKKGWKICQKNIVDGIKSCKKNTGLIGRWHTLKKEPRIVCDIAHNEAGIIQLMKQIKKERFENLHLVIGFNKEKNLNKILKIFPKKAKYYFCKAKIHRGLSAKDLKHKAKYFSLFGDYYKSVKDALYMAKKNATKEDLIIVSGSTFVVSEII